MADSKNLTGKTYVSIPVAFAEDGNKNSITISPTSVDGNIDGAAASYQYGFPPLTEVAPELGGVPPQRGDMNGILYNISDNIKYLQQGGIYTFDYDFATEIGGYAAGAILYYFDKTNDKLFLLQSTKANNKDDFTTDSSVIGKSWKYINSVYELKDYLPLKGGTLTGNVFINKPGFWDLKAKGTNSIIALTAAEPADEDSNKHINYGGAIRLVGIDNTNSSFTDVNGGVILQAGAGAKGAISKIIMDKDGSIKLQSLVNNKNAITINGDSGKNIEINGKTEFTKDLTVSGNIIIDNNKSIQINKKNNSNTIEIVDSQFGDKDFFSIVPDTSMYQRLITIRNSSNQGLGYLEYANYSDTYEYKDENGKIFASGAHPNQYGLNLVIVPKERLIKNNTNENSYNNPVGVLGIRFKRDGKAIAIAPNPETGNNGEAIATTGWSNSKMNELVKKTGDTMTGNLTLTKENAAITLKNPSWDYTTAAPVSGQLSAFRQVDKNNMILGDIRFGRETDGGQYTSIMVRNKFNGTEKSAFFTIRVNKDGTTSTSIPGTTTVNGTLTATTLTATKLISNDNMEITKNSRIY